MTATQFLGNCINTRTLFTHWYNKTQSGQMKLNSFLKLDFIYQIGIYIEFINAHNLCCSLYVGTYDLFIKRNELLPDQCDYEFTFDPNEDITVKYVYNRNYTDKVFITIEDLYTSAFCTAFKFLNTIKMKTVPF